jgi:hypothetical protein
MSQESREEAERRLWEIETEISEEKDRLLNILKNVNSLIEERDRSEQTLIRLLKMKENLKEKIHGDNG